MQSTFTQEHATDLFRLALDNSLTCIYPAPAIRDDRISALVDFRLHVTSEMFRQRIGLSEAEWQASPLPAHREHRLFERLRPVVE